MVWSIRRILVPTDFSRASEAAFDAAIEVARKHDASIVLMHAWEPPGQPCLEGSYVPLRELAADAEREALAVLVATAAAKGKVVPITTTLRVGKPCEQILEAAAEHEVSLIFIGSRGLHGPARAFLGSTAGEVVRHADIPVLTFVDASRRSGELSSSR